jgi:hypothetical protein
MIQNAKSVSFGSSENSFDSPDWGTWSLDMMSCKKELTEADILLK